VNEYSKRWFDVFLDTIPHAWTELDVAAVVRRLPLPWFRSVLDVCCGPARHAQPLAQLGYTITGVDRDRDAIERARHAVPGGTFLELDQRDLDQLTSQFDAVIVLWQSFGYFDPATNDAVLADLANLLRPGGRLLLDVFHPAYFRSHQGRHTDTRGPGCKAITNTLDGDRLRSTIEYDDGVIEIMEFEVFEPHELAERAQRHGFHTLEACCWWDEARPPDPGEPRYQLVLQRR
jgi:D-alanine-D-alanine ligase